MQGLGSISGEHESRPFSRLIVVEGRDLEKRWGQDQSLAKDECIHVRGDGVDWQMAGQRPV